MKSLVSDSSGNFYAVIKSNLYVNMSDSSLSITTNPITGVSSSGITFTASSYTLSTTSLSASSGTLSVKQYTLADQASSNAGLVWIKQRDTSNGGQRHRTQ